MEEPNFGQYETIEIVIDKPERPLKEELKERYMEDYRSRLCSYCGSRCRNMETLLGDRWYPTYKEIILVCQKCLKSWVEEGNATFN